MEIALRFNTGDDNGCAREAQSFIDKIKTSTGTYAAQQMPLPSLFLGNVQIKHRLPEEAVKTLNEAIEAAPDAPSAWLSYCYLRRGQAEDILGRREDAVQDYRRVLRLPNYRNARKTARLFLRTACTFEDAVESMENQ
jgi:tetratricopeptide (TPR) repeat protein